MTASEAVDARFSSIDALFFGLGAGKCGTTWFHRYCRDHPEICVPWLKEQNYWSRACTDGTVPGNVLIAEKRYLGFGAKKIYQRWTKPKNRALYRGTKATGRASRNPGPPHIAYADALFQEYKPAVTAVGEICPSYAGLSPNTLSDMNALNENTRFIFFMRDPAKRLISWVKHGLRKQKGIDGSDYQMLAERVKKALENRDTGPHQTTQYIKTISALEAVIPPEQVFYVFYEDLFAQPKIDEICDFLGVSHFPAKFDRHVNADVAPSVQLTDEAYAEVVRSLAEVYEAVFAKFGDRVPSAWHQSYALRDPAYV